MGFAQIGEISVGANSDNQTTGGNMNGAVALSPLILNPQNFLRRESPHPKHLRGQGYEERFDSLTVFYDCLRTADGRGTIMLGPPLFNLKHTVLRALRRVYRVPWFSRIPVLQFDRHSQLRMGPVGAVDLPPGLFQQNRLVVQPNCSEWFRGRRVVLTLSRDNELQWIRDWARFFVSKHGADSVLIYDNASTKYASDEIREVINSVPGVDVGVVIDWPYPYGIQDRILWDSDYCQYGTLEHARYRFLANAQAVVNADIDEFPITTDGESLFDIALRSGTGYLKYGGQWIENASVSPDAKTTRRRHKHYIHRSTSPSHDTGDDPWTHKWTVIPARCPPDVQWRVHDVSGMTPDPLSSLVCFRHFRAINTHWASDRWQPEETNECYHEVDEELREWLQLFDAE
jgi:hypothetical protein